MAPEQAKGRAVDRRADIWAFGVVVYEMLTAKGLFAAEDVSETLAAVLTRTVDLTALPAATPLRVQQLLGRCLERDPRMRLRDIGEARVEIEKTIASASDGATPTNPESRVTSPVRILPWAVAAALAVALGVAVWAPWRSEKPVDRPLVRLDVDLGDDAAFPSANGIFGSNIAISPDGMRLVYTAGTPRHLFTRLLDQPKASQLPGTDGASSPFFSLDGRWVGFDANGKVNKISVDGGAVVALEDIQSFAGATWAEDGSILVSDMFGKGLLQLPAAGGAFNVLAPAVRGDTAIGFPQLLPGDRAVLLSACPGGSLGNCNVELLTLADRRRQILARGGQSPHYVPASNRTGHLIYVNKATLFAIAFDLESLETRGSAVPVLDDVGSGNANVGLFDVSRTGTLIYRRARVDPAPLMTLQWIDASGRQEPLGLKPAVYGNTHRLSPDGKRIVVTIREGANEDVWIYDPQRDTMTRLTFGGVNVLPVWSPDGQSIVFATIQGLFQARADGASPPHALTGSKTAQVPWSFTPDGKRLAYYENGPPAQIWTLPLDDQGGELKAGKPERFLASTFQDSRPSFSPDGRWLAYVSNESGKDEVYVRPFPSSSGQGGKWQVSNNGGAGPHWSRTRHELVYRSVNQLMTVGYSVNGDTFVAEKPRVWIAAFPGATWDLAPDGKRVAVLIADAAAKAPAPDHEIVMLQNFADELRRRVPLGR